MKKLGITDASFLHLERDGAPMAIASLQRFAPPYDRFDAHCFFNRLKRYLADRVHGVEFMIRRLKSTPFDLDQPVWVSDGAFDIDHHVFRTRLQTPGTERQLNTLVAKLHERPLNRNRPLWEMHFIDGLEDGTFALYSKYHHAAVDGVSGQLVMKLLYSSTAEADPPPLPAPRVEQPNDAQLFLDALMNLSLQPFEQLSRMGERMRAMGKLTELLAQSAVATGAAPPTRFNVHVGPYRGYATTTLPLHTMRLLGRKLGVSVNDVLLEVCAGGLRAYLEQRGELPQEPLLAGIPVSLRSASDHSFSNRVSMLRASLATDLEDPVQRLASIAESTRLAKTLLEETRALIPEDLHLPGLSYLLRSAVAASERLGWQRMTAPFCNLVISNVPGPRRPRYLLGARMLTHHPVSIPADGNALNITVQSYGDRLDLGVTACLDAVPDVEALREDLELSWLALRDACLPEAVAAAA